MSQRYTSEQLERLLHFLDTAAEDEGVVASDCDDGCGGIAAVAERVACGERLAEIWPELDAHLRTYPDKREEFDAMVVIFRAQREGKC